MKLRPQIFISIIILGFIASLAIFMDMVEIATGCVTLIGALGMKILDTDSQFKTIGGSRTPFASNEDKAKKEYG